MFEDIDEEIYFEKQFFKQVKGSEKEREKIRKMAQKQTEDLVEVMAGYDKFTVEEEKRIKKMFDKQWKEFKKMVEERARIAIHNGTAIFGLAAETQTYLQDLGVNVTEIGNADSATYNRTQIIDYGSHPQTTRFLIQEMQVPPMNLSDGTRADGDYDVLVIIGNDWANAITSESSS